ncbi:MAG TPA: SAP domain-containing protein [Gammaproteobacteria bacterium]
MQIQAIRTIAKAQGITPHKMDKHTLIRTIQRQEGNFDCFGSANEGFCDQGGCLWRHDCLPVPAPTKRPRNPPAK